MGVLNDLLNLPGPDFLLRYLALGGLATAGSWLLSRDIWFSPESIDNPTPPTPYELAYVAGGRKRVAETLLASLVHFQLLSVNIGTRQLQRVGKPIPGMSLLEREALAALDKPMSYGQAKARIARMGGAMTSLRDTIREKEYIHRLGARLLLKLMVFLPVAVVLAIGCAKLRIGWELGRPVGFLILFSLAMMVLGLAFALKSGWATPLGRKLLRDSKDKLDPLKEMAPAGAPYMRSNEVAAVTALYGVTVFDGGSLGFLATEANSGWARKHEASAGCGAGGGCGGASGCGGGCGGCGA